ERNAVAIGGSDQIIPIVHAHGGVVFRTSHPLASANFPEPASSFLLVDFDFIARIGNFISTNEEAAIAVAHRIHLEAHADGCVLETVSMNQKADDRFIVDAAAVQRSIFDGPIAWPSLCPAIHGLAIK